MLAVIVILVVQSLSLGVSLAKHGKPHTGKHNVCLTAVGIGIFWVFVWWLNVGLTCDLSHAAGC